MHRTFAVVDGESLNLREYIDRRLTALLLTYCGECRRPIGTDYAYRDDVGVVCGPCNLAIDIANQSPSS